MCLLQVDSRIGAQLLESIIFIIDSVLPLIRKLPFSVTEDLEQDLKHMIVRHSFLTVVHACVRYPLLLSNPHSWLYRSFLAFTYVHFYLDDHVSTWNMQSRNTTHLFFKDTTFYLISATLQIRRCLCSVSKLSGKGVSVVEHLLQFFLKRLEAHGSDNNQVSFP